MPPEPDGTFLPSVILTLLFLLFSALYAASESALRNLNEGRLKKDADGGNAKAKILFAMLDRQTGILSPLQSGLLFCGFAGLACAMYAFDGPLDAALSALPFHRTLTYVAIILLYSLVFLAFADLLPRKGARHKAQSFSYRYASLIHLLYTLARPFLFLCSAASNGVLRLFRVNPHALDDVVTEEEILQMVGEGEEKGVIEENEKDMIRNILEFNDTTAGETMTHRTDIVAVEDTATLPEVIEAAVENGNSRLPVYHEDIDTVVGMCYVKDLLPYVGQQVPDFIKLTDLMRPVFFVPESKKCSQLFTELTERKVQIAIVVDEYGGTAGLITLEDLVESIVGNIQDEYDNEEEEIQKVSETEFTVDGTTSIDEISDLTGVELPEGDYDTIAGLVTDILGRIPKEDEHPSVEVCGLSITVCEVEDQRLSRLSIVKQTPPEPELPTKKEKPEKSEEKD